MWARGGALRYSAAFTGWYKAQRERMNVRMIMALAIAASSLGAACGDDGNGSGTGGTDAASDGGGGDVAVDVGGSDTAEDTGSTDADSSDTAPDAPAPDVGLDVGEGDFCSDDSLGSGTTPTPTPTGDADFTTVLEACSLNAAEAAICYGAAHSSSIAIQGDRRVITSNAIPDHDVDLFPNAGNPNVVTAQALTWSIPLNPTRGNNAIWARTIGVGLNGIKMEPETAETYSGTQWKYEALTFGGRVTGDTTNAPPLTSLGLDCNFAHVQPNGEYHYHGVPTAILPESPAVVQVGWALDGYPILGRWGYETPGDESSAVVELRGSFRVRSGARAALGGETPPPGDYDGTFVQDWEYVEGLGDLDECNGRAETIVIDGQTFDYAYYLTHTYPWSPRCLWSAVDDGGGGGTPFEPTPCASEADCVDACGADALGCTCVDSPRDGMICVATCNDDGDCPDGMSCGGMDGGICVPAGGGPP